MKEFHNRIGKELRFPLSKDTVALFIAHMDQKGYTKGTITSYVSAIGYFHRTLGLEDLTNSNLIKRCISGLKNHTGRNRRKPIKIRDLKNLIKASRTTLSSRDSIAFQTIVTLLFFGFFRVSEILGDKRNNIPCLDREDVKIHRSKLNIKLRQYKHSKGNVARVSLKRQNDELICPINSMHEYLIKVNPTNTMFMNKTGSPLTKNSFSQMLKSCSLAAGYTKPFTSHCFRIGATSYASMLGHSESQIKTMGRWRSQAYVGYIRRSQALVARSEREA